MDMKNRLVVYFRNHDCPCFPKSLSSQPLACVLSNLNITLLQYCITNISSDTDSNEYKRLTFQIDHVLTHYIQ